METSLATRGALAIQAAPGDSFGGGFYAGRIAIEGQPFAIVVAPRGAGEHGPIRWGDTGACARAGSFYDGFANTEAMARCNSGLARWTRSLQIGGFDDWYLPSRDELELCYRYLKPAAHENYVWRSGDNPSSLPPGYPYTSDLPAQTKANAFRIGADESFNPSPYWTSTPCAGAAEYAWYQTFYNGHQDLSHKGNERRARAVRRVPI